MANNNREMGGMLTVGEVAQLLYVHSNTLRRWTEKGIIKAYRIGPRGDRRFRQEDIAVLLRGYNRGVQVSTAKRNQQMSGVPGW